MDGVLPFLDLTVYLQPYTRPQATITKQQYDRAPLLMAVDFEMLNGNKDELQRPMHFGSKYLGDANPPSEIGLCVFDVRWLFGCVPGPSHQPPAYRHKTVPGPYCRNWLSDSRLFRSQHYINRDLLAADLQKLSGTNPEFKRLNDRLAPQSFAFGESKFCRNKLMPEAFDQLVGDYYCHGQFEKTKEGGNGPSLQRDICFVLHSAKLGDPSNTVRFFDIQMSSRWRRHTTNNRPIGEEALAQSLGMTRPDIHLHNAGNDATIRLMGMIRYLTTRGDELSAYHRGQPLQAPSIFPRDLTRWRQVNQTNFDK